MATEVAARPAAGPRYGRERTIGALWRAAADNPASTPAYLVETESGWTPVSWEAAARRVDELANGLLALGLRKGDCVAILGSTSLDWAQVDFACALVGAVVAPVYANSSPKDVGYVLCHSDAIAVVVEDEAQRAKVEQVRAAAPGLQHVVSFAELDGLAARGRAYREEDPHALERASEAVSEEDLFTYLYTSGTTGPPKACMIRHRNYYAMAALTAALEGSTLQGDTMLLYLPLAHNFGRLMHLSGPYVGFTLAFLADPLRVGEALPQVRPTVFPSVPRVYEKVYTAVRSSLESSAGLQGRIGDWALEVGRRASPYKLRGRPLPRGLALQHRLADRLVYSRVKARLGGRLRSGISGGAPLAREIAEFFHSLDITIVEGYGLSECTTACTVNRPGAMRFGTVGPAIPGFELRIDDDGEILIRSETVFAGYLKDEAATAEVLTPDGWLRSGDIGELDGDGFLTITDRKKDIIVTAGGKNVAPQNLENALKSATLVSQALVVGDRRKYLVALITLDEVEARRWAAANGASADLPELAADPRVEALVQGVVDGVNRDLSRFEQVKRFAILPRDFSAEEGEVTPTLKLKRRACEEHFAAEIAALYA